MLAKTLVWKPLRRFFYTTINIISEALFPISSAEREVFSMGEVVAFKKLPRASRAPIPEAGSIFSYKDERVSKLIWSIKYKKSKLGVTYAGYAIYKVVSLFLKAIPPNMQVVIVPMPITRARRRERGFNQCDLILEEIKRVHLSNLHTRSILFASDMLIRIHHTSRQTMKNRADRLASVKKLFTVNKRSESFILLSRLSKISETSTSQKNPFEDYFVIIIDDVITTGSTIRDSIMTLREAGFENSYGLSVAH